MNGGSFAGLMRWEFRRLKAERVGLGLIAIWCGLVALAAWQGVGKAREGRAEIELAREADRANWTAKRARFVEVQDGRVQPEAFADPRSPTNSVMGRSGERPVVLEPTALAPLALGSGDLRSPVKRVSMVNRLVGPGESLENPANRLAGPVDLAFVTSALLPLFVLALAFDLLARERDLKIWPLLASQPVSLRAIAAARLAVHFGLLLGPLAIGSAVALLGAGGGGSAGAWCEWALWVGLAALYLAFWQALVAGVNFRPTSAATNALILGAAWLGAVVLLPAAVQGVVHRLTPPPDRREFVLALREIDTDLFKRADTLRDALYAANPDWVPARALNEYDTYYVHNLYPRALAADAALAPVLSDLHAAKTAQAASWRRFGGVSPALAFRLATDLLAGVTPLQQETLDLAAQDFQQRWRVHFGRALATMTPLTLTDYDTKPEPTVVTLPLAERFHSARSLMLALVAASALAIGLAVRLGREGGRR